MRRPWTSRLGLRPDRIRVWTVPTKLAQRRSGRSPYLRAFARWQKKRRGNPQAPEIFVFFKHNDSASMADAGPQLQKVLDFRKSLEESR